MGAFGLNASIMDAANIAWKIGLVAQNKARLETLLPTYSVERRLHAVRIIKVSGRYLRFVCDADLDADASMPDELKPAILDPESDGQSPQTDLDFLAGFFRAHGSFLLGVDAPYEPSVINGHFAKSARQNGRRAVKVNNGVRAPNPRVCFSVAETGYLYDKMKDAAKFHLVLFASSIQGAARDAIRQFSAALGPTGFYQRFGGSSIFNIIVVVECLPFELDELLPKEDVASLIKEATFLFDDRAPDENAHTTWGVDRATGGLAVVRPDLWVGMTTYLSDVQSVNDYFDAFLLSDS